MRNSHPFYYNALSVLSTRPVVDRSSEITHDCARCGPRETTKSACNFLLPSDRPPFQYDIVKGRFKLLVKQAIILLPSGTTYTVVQESLEDYLQQVQESLPYCRRSGAMFSPTSSTRATQPHSAVMVRFVRKSRGGRNLQKNSNIGTCTTCTWYQDLSTRVVENLTLFVKSSIFQTRLKNRNETFYLGVPQRG
jgi:hypothetical protein